MDEKTERPELGTTEAAVRSCVNLIALATHTSEELLAYWLDLYYQTRKAHEKVRRPLDYSELLVAAGINEKLAKDDAPAVEGGILAAAETCGARVDIIKNPAPFKCLEGFEFVHPPAPPRPNRSSDMPEKTPEAPAAQKKTEPR